AARERPPTGEPEAAVPALHLPGRRVRRADEDAGVLPPDVALRLLGEQLELPVVDPDHAEEPRARRACGADVRDGLEEAERAQLETAPSPRLKRPKKARSLVGFECFVGEPAQGFAFRCSAPKVLGQLVGASAIRLVVHLPSRSIVLERTT